MEASLWTQTSDHKVSYSILGHQIPGKTGNIIRGTGQSSAHLGIRAVVPISSKIEITMLKSQL
ncbi:hypothetical protein I79_013089 [Cricetulus griseus]|uniref:Uncharacterized protein n=1 Tax=Cricetulus griseus TaxID=10029 RepID=G3HQI7_CRIGR|nr:hypothetical protein I79_013089 [Cricetulus griseus]